jgi:hypothetical protein
MCTGATGGGGLTHAQVATLAGTVPRQDSCAMSVGVTHASVAPYRSVWLLRRIGQTLSFSFFLLLSSPCGGFIGDLDFSPQIRAHGGGKQPFGST